MTAPVKFTQDNDAIDRATGREIGYVQRYDLPNEWYAWAFRPPITVEWRTFLGCYPTRLAAGLAILDSIPGPIVPLNAPTATDGAESPIFAAGGVAPMPPPRRAPPAARHNPNGADRDRPRA